MGCRITAPEDTRSVMVAVGTAVALRMALRMVLATWNASVAILPTSNLTHALSAPCQTAAPKGSISAQMTTASTAVTALNAIRPERAPP